MARLVAHPGVFVLFLCAAGLFLIGIGSYQQFLRAEAPFAVGARALLASGEILLPHSPQELPLTRPPLYYWLTALSYSVFGVSYGAARVPSALSALGTLGLVYVLGQRLYCRTVGVTAVAMLGTSYIFWSLARLAMPDMLLSLFITGAVTAWILVLTGGAQHHCVLRLAGYAAMSGGMLTKGPIAPVLSALPVIFDMLLTRRWSTLKLLRPGQGILVFLLLAMPYFVLVWLLHGVEPLKTFFLNENLHRFTGTTFHTFTVPVLYEIAAFLTDFAPWSPLILLGVGGYLATMRHGVPPPQTRLLMLWMLSPLVFFMVSRFKCDYYFLPAMPPAAILVAQAIYDGSLTRGWAKHVGRVLAVLIALLLPIAIWVSLDIVHTNFSDPILRWLPHSVLAMGLMTALWLALRRSPTTAVLATAGTMWAATLSAYMVFSPHYAELQPAEILARHLPLDATVYIAPGAAEWANDVALYASRMVPPPFVVDLPQIEHALKKDHQAVALLDADGRRELERRGLGLRVVAWAEAYTGNRLTLKSLRQPRHGTLYLVTEDQYSRLPGMTANDDPE